MLEMIKSDTPVGGNDTTTVHAGMKIEGKLTTSGDILIEGSVLGEIKANAVTIAKGATVNGTINASTVVVNGSVEGTINSLKLQINTDATARGEFTQSILSVAPGASFEGKIHQKSSSVSAMPQALEKKENKSF